MADQKAGWRAVLTAEQTVDRTAARKDGQSVVQTGYMKAAPMAAQTVGL